MMQNSPLVSILPSVKKSRIFLASERIICSNCLVSSLPITISVFSPNMLTISSIHSFTLYTDSYITIIVF